MSTPKTVASRKPQPKFVAPVQPDAILAAIVGKEPLPRTEIVSKLWAYFKKHKLQDATNRRQINADALTRPFFGAEHITMFEVGGLISKHLSK